MSKSIVQTVLCVGFVIAAALVQGEEWTQFRYLTANTGYAIDRKAPGDPANLVRHLLSIEPEDGNIVWRKAVPAQSDKNEFNTWGVGLHGYASSTPAVDKTGIYVFFGETGVLAFRHTGELLYEERLDPPPDRIYASPLLANGRLYYTSREDGIYVVAAKPEFELLAHTKLEGDDSIFNASPVPLPGGSVLLRSDKYLYRLKPANSQHVSTTSGCDRIQPIVTDCKGARCR